MVNTLEEERKQLKKDLKKAEYGAPRGFFEEDYEYEQRKKEDTACRSEVSEIHKKYCEAAIESSGKAIVTLVENRKALESERESTKLFRRDVTKRILDLNHYEVREAQEKFLLEVQRFEKNSYANKKVAEELKEIITLITASNPQPGAANKARDGLLNVVQQP